MRHTLEELLLQLSLGDFDLNSLVHLLLVALLVVGIVLDGGGEQCVDEGCLSQSRLASDLDSKMLANSSEHENKYSVSSYHDREASTTLGNNLVSLVGEIGNANRRSALSSGSGSHCEDD